MRIVCRGGRRGGSWGLQEDERGSDPLAGLGVLINRGSKQRAAPHFRPPPATRSLQCWAAGVGWGTGTSPAGLLCRDLGSEGRKLGCSSPFPSSEAEKHSCPSKPEGKAGARAGGSAQEQSGSGQSSHHVCPCCSPLPPLQLRREGHGVRRRRERENGETVPFSVSACLVLLKNSHKWERRAWWWVFLLSGGGPGRCFGQSHPCGSDRLTRTGSQRGSGQRAGPGRGPAEVST